MPGKMGKHENHIFHTIVLVDSAAAVNWIVLHAQCISAMSSWKKNIIVTCAVFDRLQAGRTNVQSTQHWDTIIPQPQPSHQTKDIYTSSTLFIPPATTETHNQDTFCRSRFSLHSTYRLELSEQLHCRQWLTRRV